MITIFKSEPLAGVGFAGHFLTVRLEDFGRPEDHGQPYSPRVIMAYAEAICDWCGVHQTLILTREQGQRWFYSDSRDQGMDIVLRQLEERLAGEAGWKIRMEKSFRTEARRLHFHSMECFVAGWEAVSAYYERAEEGKRKGRRNDERSKT